MHKWRAAAAAVAGQVYLQSFCKCNGTLVPYTVAAKVDVFYGGVPCMAGMDGIQQGALYSRSLLAASAKTFHAMSIIDSSNLQPKRGTYHPKTGSSSLQAVIFAA